MKKNRDEIFKYVNENLQDYEGYIQLMGEKISKEKHVFLSGGLAPGLAENELIYEAYFFSKSKNKSISIRQINDAWFVDETDLSSIKFDENDIKTFYSKFGDFKIKMAQIWTEENDELCEKMPVLKFKKAVFAGFVKDKKDEK